MIFDLAGIPVEVEYRKIKNLRLTVYPPDGRVKIAAPAGTTAEYIKKFAASKFEWVKEQRKKIKDNSKKKKAKESPSLKNNSTVYVWGQAHELELIERQGHPKITIKDGRMIMSIRPGSTKAKRQELLDKWYRKTLKESAPEIIEKWEGRIGVTVQKIFVRKMKTHWGSCNRENQTLRLNSELVKQSPICLEYVIVHEMLHFFEKGHNQKYYRMLSKHMPDWKTIRKQMNAGEL
ncbi:MAG: M48 family metallopeptidase [Treponema sp.]|nr:M48 family metallopeptidase [Treponema sp.]